VLSSGKIIESGNHEELMQLNGEYWRQVQNQLFDDTNENEPTEENFGSNETGLI